MHVHQNRYRTFGIHDFHPTREYTLDGRLNAEVERKLQWRALFTDVTQTVIKLQLNPGRPQYFGCSHVFSAKACPTKHMRSQRSVRVQAHFTRAQQQPRIANIKDRLFLFWTDLFLHPDKPAFAQKVPGQTVFVQIWKDPHQLLN